MNTGELTEEKLVNRMTAENTYNDTKKELLDSETISVTTIHKMEQHVKREAHQKGNSAELSM